MKSRLIVDMLRSCGNFKSSVPERPVMPRLWDTVVLFLHFLSLALAWCTAWSATRAPSFVCRS